MASPAALNVEATAAACAKSGPHGRRTPEDRQRLAEQLMASTNQEAWSESNNTWVDKLGQRLEQWGVETPQVEVSYKGINVDTQALVGAASVPTVISPLVGLAKTLLCMRERAEEKPLRLLDDVSGVLKPGRMTLLLGPPSSGKSTFMKLLAGRLPRAKMHTEGNVWYNGEPSHDFHHVGSSSYVAQMDNHEPNLTVYETLDFAWACTNGLHGAKFNAPLELYKAKLAAKVVGGAADRLEAGLGVRGVAESSESAAGLPSTDPSSADTTSVSEEEKHGRASMGIVPTASSRGKGVNAVSWIMRGGGAQKNTPARCPSVETDEFEEIVNQVWGTQAKVDVLMKLVGLNHCRTTQVGNEVFRGISGGEKKRLTTAEQLMGPQSVVIMDEISTGLDSATLFTIIRWFSKLCHALRKTVLISLLQPPPEVFQLFDDVLIFCEGGVLYHGPVAGAVPFFASIGLVCPERKDVPSFLLEVTTVKGQLAYASPELRAAHGLHGQGEVLRGSTAGHRQQLLIPLADISHAFWTRNEHGIAMAKELAAAPVKRPSHPAALVHHNDYPLTLWESVVAATNRQSILVLRDRVLLRGRLMQVLILSLIMGSLFYRLPTDLPGARSFFGFAFLLTLMINFGGFPQLPLTIDAKKVWFKHRSNHFLPAVAQGSAMAFAQVPLSIAETTMFSVILYFMVDLYRMPSEFFTFFLICFLNSMTSSAVFRFLACASPNVIVANALAGILLVTLVIMSGFAIVRTDIPDWMIWAYWISPFSWSLRAYIINEIDTPKWQDLPYPGRPGTSLGDGALHDFAFYTDRKWIWYNLAFQGGLYILLTLASSILLWLQPAPTPRATLPNEEVVAAARAAAEAHREALAARREAVAQANAQAEANANGGGDSPSKKALKQTRTGVGAMAVETEVDISSSLEFQPITLVFKDIRYTVPNPNYSAKAAKAAAAQAAKAANKAAKAAAAPGGRIELDTRASSSLEQEMARQAAAAAAAVCQERLQLLQGITGYSEPGVLTALMGGSGAGKTTFMDCVAGRKTVGDITGEIWVNGHPKDQRTWSRVVGYCEQTDIHSPMATVKEALLFSARLRLPASVSNQKVAAYVDEVLDIVDMVDIQFALVGTPGESGLSVEQRKRLTIAVELVANPSVVFMDEPTSGLDARAAAIVMQAVRNVARNGRSVMVTIHQPSIEIFEAFDMLLLIQRGGRTTFFGPLGEHSSGLINFLMSVPATWMLEVTGGSMATTVKSVDVDWPSMYESSQLAADARAHAESLVAQAQADNVPALAIASQYAMPFPVQLRMMVRKFWLLYWRNPGYNLSRLAITFITTWIYAATYWGEGKVSNPADIANVQAVMGIMYSSINFLGMINLMTVMPLVSYERVVFYRERGASMYNPFAAGIAITLVELPYLFALACVYMPIMYFTIQFRADAESFFYYFLMFLFNIMFYNTLGQALTYITPSQGIAQVLAGAVNLLMNVFNGFLIPYPQIAHGWRWANRIAPTTWVIYGMAVSQLDSTTTQITYNAKTTSVRQFMEDYFGYEKRLQWWCLLILVAYIVALRVAGVLALRYVNFLKR